MCYGQTSGFRVSGFSGFRSGFRRVSIGRKNLNMFEMKDGRKQIRYIQGHGQLKFKTKKWIGLTLLRLLWKMP